MFLRQAHNPAPVSERDGRGSDSQRLRASCRQRRERAIKIVGAIHFNRLELQMQGTRSTLRFLVLKHGAADVRIPHNRYSREPGDGFLQELQPLGAELRGKTAETGDISPGTR